ncbi:hypothetical protein [Streptomyces sp. XY006]|nr:hypothetical protein [Streptomyces sp. XY006]
MITEIAQTEIHPGQEKEFEEAVAKALALTVTADNQMRMQAGGNRGS